MTSSLSKSSVMIFLRSESDAKALDYEYKNSFFIRSVHSLVNFVKLLSEESVKPVMDWNIIGNLSKRFHITNTLTNYLTKSELGKPLKINSFSLKIKLGLV